MKPFLLAKLLFSLLVSLLLLLGACAGDPPLPETTVVDTAAVAPVPQPKPQIDPPLAAAELVDEIKAPQEVARADEIALPDRRAAAARVAKRPAGTEVGYLLLDLETGQVLAELNPDLPLIPASTAKLATAVVALDVLGPEHRFRTELLADMLELATLTRPGPFTVEAMRLGEFWGVKVGGRLAAMAGERMMQPGHAEISGVCTHPDFQGRGLARRLMAKLIRRQMARGETPVLHVMSVNEGAIALYKRMGFDAHRESVVRVISRREAG